MITTSLLHPFPRRLLHWHWQYQQQVRTRFYIARHHYLPWCADSESPAKPWSFALSFIQAAVRGHVEKEHASRNPRQEFIDYINSPLEINQYDPIKWWGVRYLKAPGFV